MKNKVIYFMAVWFAAFTCFSCSDSDDDSASDLIGAWKYETSHFTLDYSEIALQLPNGMTLANLVPGLSDGIAATIGKLTAIPISQLNNIALGMLHGQIAKSFRGVEIESDTKLKMLMIIDGVNKDVPATYTRKKNTITITMDKEVMQEMLGENTEISTLSLKYTMNEDKLMMYLDKTAIQALLTPAVLAQLPAKIPAEYVKDVLDKTKMIEVGAVMKRNK